MSVDTPKPSPCHSWTEQKGIFLDVKCNNSPKYLTDAIEIAVTSGQVKSDIWRHLKNDEDIQVNCHPERQKLRWVITDEDISLNTNHEAEENDHKTVQQKLNIDK